MYVSAKDFLINWLHILFNIVIIIIVFVSVYIYIYIHKKVRNKYVYYSIAVYSFIKINELIKNFDIVLLLCI